MRIGSVLYHFAKKENVLQEDVNRYSARVGYLTGFGNITVQPISGENLNTATYGQSEKDKWQIACNYIRYKDTFKVGDLLGIDSEEANAIITSVKKQNRLIILIAEKTQCSD